MATMHAHQGKQSGADSLVNKHSLFVITLMAVQEKMASDSLEKMYQNLRETRLTNLY